MSAELILATPRRTGSSKTVHAPRGAGAVATRLYGRVLADILHGRIEPGRPLKLLPLSTHYGTSTGTLREVLIQLTGDRFVVRDKRFGFQIAPANQADLFELTKTVTWLEEIGIRESIANGDRHWEEDLVVAHRALAASAGQERVFPTAALSVWEEQVLDYHETLVKACRSSILVAQCRALNQHLVRYLNLAANAAPQFAHGHDELLAIGTATLQRNAERALQLLDAYLRQAAFGVLSSAVLN